MTLISQSKRIDWAKATLMALAVVALSATCANATIIQINGISGGNNGAVPSSFGSNLSSDIGGATVSNGTTPDIALTWAGGGAGGWDLHGGGNGIWAALDPAGPGSGTPTIAQIEPGNPQNYIDFTVAAGKRLVLNSVDIGMATDKTATYNWTITIAVVGGAVVATHNPPAMDGDGGSGVQAQTVTLNFTGDPGVDYRLQFSDSPDTNGGGVDNLSFNQVDAAGIVWSAPTTSAITINSATASASVDTALTETVLVWEEAATAPNPGSTNDWTYLSSFGSKSAGPVTAPISSLSADTEYTWRFYGETASTNGWSGATTFVTAFSDAQAPAFTNAEALSFSEIQLNWQDNAVHETGYLLRRSPNSGSGPYTTVDVGNTTTYSDTGLSAGSTYYYELAATNSANGSATDFSKCVTNATTTTMQPGTIIVVNGMSQGSNVDVPNGFGSNLSSDIPGATVFGGGTPDIALDWAPATLWETHGSAVWNALDPANSGVDVAQMEAGTQSITFTVANGQALKLNSVDIGMATDKTATYNFTITISEVGGAVVATYTPPAMDGDGSSGVQAQTVALNFTGDPGVDYKLEFSDSPDTNGGAIDNLYFSQVAPLAVQLSGTTVASNAVIGTLVGDLSFTTNDQSGITYSLPVTGTGPDSGSFQITSVTNLRTAATIAQASYAISVEAHFGGASLGTNDFTITVDPVASTYSAFIVAAEAASGVASGGELVGVLQAQGADPSAFTFSLNSGRTDLFEIDGTGTNLVQIAGTDPGVVGTVHYTRIEAANAVTTNNLVVAVQVVDSTPSTTLFMFR